MIYAVQLYNPTIKYNLAHSFECWARGQIVAESNPIQVRFFYCLQI